MADLYILMEVTEVSKLCKKFDVSLSIDQVTGAAVLEKKREPKKHRVKMEELRLNQERKNKDSDEEEEDLATIKQRLVNKARMKAPGRFYIDKAREKETICEEEVRMQSSSSYRTSVKRKASEDEMVAHLGYM